MKKQPIIEFKNFTFQYRAQSEPTIHDINLTIYKGEKVLIAGPSGSGKSTISNCINGLIPFSYQGVSTGTLFVDGEEVNKKSLFELSKVVGTVLQDTDGQFIALTVGEDIAFSLENDCVPYNEMHAKTKTVAALVGIDKHLQSSPHQLSGGQKQRVSLAGVMVDKVKILLFDEPLANLDPATGKQAIELIDEIHKSADTENAATIIIIEHRLEDVLHCDVDRIILMDEGRIVADFPPNVLLSSNLLEKHGIREPLYLTALKYGGVAVSEDKLPQYVETMLLSDFDIQKVKDWLKDTSPKSPEQCTEPLLEVKNISFSYDNARQVLKNVSFTVYKGEMVAIVGSNGAGKSTLSKLICGFEKPSSGSIFMSGNDLKDKTIAQRANRIGFVMQNPNQMISKTMIFDEVALALRSRKVSEDEVKSRVEETLKVCGLYQFRNWPISALSFGQKKRVTIASVLVQRPEIIILDEPTAGQDFYHYTEIMEFLRTLNKQGITVIMITHDMHLMLEYTPRAIVFAEGQLVENSSAAKVLTNPEVIKRASLKETSLFELAKRCMVEVGHEFVQHFIDYDREVRSSV